MSDLLTETDVRKRIKAIVDINRTQLEAALAMDVSPSYLSDCLLSKRAPGAKLLKAVGLERVVCYRRIKP